MSHIRNLRFTDAVKDVIGNDPVLDQFDTFYAASFYGTMSDDYVTGTMVSENTNLRITTGAKKVLLTTGSRGRAFSKYYARSQPPLDSTYGSLDVSKNSSLAYRQVPWHERTSNTYRTSQCIDEIERIYDSCLPNLKNCFDSDGASIWTFSDNPQFALSPYGNVETGSVGYMRFNDLEVKRQGFNNDPLVNNIWTWSYPYENKYIPQDRFIDSSQALGIETSNTETPFLPFTYLTVNKTDVNKKIDKFFPILPGHHERKDIGNGGRNGLRPIMSGTSTMLPSGSMFDDIFGISDLIPSDVRLNQLVSQDFLDPYPHVTKPSPSLLTGTMNYDDTVKFLFGFGDLNNMAYSKYNADETNLSSSYTEGFENNLNGNYVTGVLSFSNNTTSVDWSNSYYPLTWQGWKVLKKETIYNGYNVISASFSGSTTDYLTGGVIWPSIPLNDKVLASNTHRSNKYDPYTQDENQMSIAVVDITSSNPWRFQYDRAVHADPSDFLFTYFAAIPGYSSNDFPVFAIPIDVVVGNNPQLGPNSVVTMSQYMYPYLIPPGPYRIGFAYIKTAPTFSSVGNTGIIDRAFIDNITVKQVDIVNTASLAVPDKNSFKYGCNNYPHFRKTEVDSRYFPIFPFTETVVSGTAQAYSSYQFGLSPVIRGWKYGLYSGFTAHSKATFRRDRFGQFRDMLEQRIYTKFINDSFTPFGEEATSGHKITQDPLESAVQSNQHNPGNLGPSPVSVKFVKQAYTRNERGIGKIYLVSVDPATTKSQNLSTEVTSSLPYFDGVARNV